MKRVWFVAILAVSIVGQISAQPQPAPRQAEPPQEATPVAEEAGVVGPPPATNTTIAVCESTIATASPKWIEEQKKWKEQFALSCPYGGEDNVVIHPALGREFSHWRRGGVAGILMRRYVMVHRGKNPYVNMTLDITNGGERVISCMCPGGSITLVQSMPPFVGGYYMRVVWTAEGIVEGRLAYGDSSPGVLYQGYYNSEAIAKRTSWVMNLTRVDREF